MLLFYSIGKFDKMILSEIKHSRSAVHNQDDILSVPMVIEFLVTWSPATLEICKGIGSRFESMANVKRLSIFVKKDHQIPVSRPPTILLHLLLNLELQI